MKKLKLISEKIDYNRIKYKISNIIMIYDN